MSKLDDFIEECLREHNVRRALHGAPPLKHSRSLDKTAQDWCEELISEESIRNSPLSSRGELGESISMRTSTSSQVDMQGAEVVAQWYADIRNYNFKTGKGPAGNFTQLVWNATREVGFGKACAVGKCIVVAHYRPPGNVRGHYLTNVLPPADQTAPLSTEAISSNGNQSEQGTRRSLVTETVTEPSGRKYTIRREIIESSEADGRIKRCINETYSDITESNAENRLASGVQSSETDAQETITEKPELKMDPQEEFCRTVARAHNICRQMHDVPELKLDRELCQMAQEWARHLVKQAFLSNSGSTYQGIRLGESIFSRWSNTSVQITGQEMVNHWYDEVSKYKFDVEPESVQGIGSFSQIVWAGSQRLGVGFATQRKKTATSEGPPPVTKFIGVCLYYPPGNVVGQFKANVKPVKK